MENNSSTTSFWRKCSTCKKPIAFGATYWICSVSTCQKDRTGFVFCSVDCCDAHIPVMNHRDAGAYERVAPSPHEGAATSTAGEGHKRILVKAPASSGLASNTAASTSGAAKREVLVVVSKIKDYVRASSGFNTSDGIMELLSDKLRIELDLAVEHARADGRKTVLDRDIRR